MNNHRELLEMAAKAAGIELTWKEPSCGGGEMAYTGAGSYMPMIWHPLGDDGDALRLAVKLRITVELTARTVLAAVDGAPPRGDVLDLLGADPNAATRRAIVRAAAAIGKSMP